MDGFEWDPGERGRLALLSCLTVGALYYPLRQYLRDAEDRVDGFPLSYYPMFSKRRRQMAKVIYAVAVHRDGSQNYLPQEVLGSGGFNQVRHQLNRIVKWEHTEEYATTLAHRLAADPRWNQFLHVEVVRGRFNLDECLLNRKVQGTTTVLAVADIPKELLSPREPMSPDSRIATAAHAASGPQS